MTHSVRILGNGRAGGAFAGALAEVGWTVEIADGRSETVASGVDLVLVCVPDAALRAVVTSIAAGESVVAHVSGSLGLDALDGHRRRAAIHPLVALPSAGLGASRLRSGATFAVAGDPIALEVVASLGGRSIEIADDSRAAYHAAACIASNHLVGLLGQAERVAATAGVPLDAYLDLVRGTLDNVSMLGPAAALTGPVSRGDEATLDRHRAALDPSELDAYDAMVLMCRRLIGDPR